MIGSHFRHTWSSPETRREPGPLQPPARNAHRDPASARHRCGDPHQGPLHAHINDDADTRARLWQTQVGLGFVTSYELVDGGMGARRCFALPVARATEIHRDAMQRIFGLGRTARGPSMSAGAGKVEVRGVTEIHGENGFVVRFTQGRNPDWVQRRPFARGDAATVARPAAAGLWRARILL